MKRRDAGLPEDKIVFAAFNAVRKISPPLFEAWMRIVEAVPESVLWLLCSDPVAQANLLDHAARKGVAAERIVFAAALGPEMHVARLQAASIALDTFPYNGHTTTSDILWAGLPVVTLRGRNFASRVSESLLGAIGAEDLVAASLDDYVALAIRLANGPEELARLRKTLAFNRLKAPLFDTARYTRHLEMAFAAMARRCRSGQAPDHIDVPRLAVAHIDSAGF